MSLLQLAETLRVRSYLNATGVKNELITLALETLEKFVDRLKSGPFRLRPEGEAQQHMNDIRQVLAAISATEPDKVTITTHSLTQLIGVEPAGQMVLYSLAESGSVSYLLERAPHDVARDKAHELQHRHSLRGGLEARMKELFVDAKLLDILFETRYGGFARIFEDSILMFFCQLFAYALINDHVMVGRLLPLAKIFRSNMPIGRLPLVPEDSAHHWSIFIE